MIVAEQPTETFSPHHVTHVTTNFSLWHDASVIEALMIALSMIVGEVLVEHVIEGAFTQHDHLLQGLLLDGTHEPLAVGMQIRAPGRQDDRFYAAGFQEPVERLRKLRTFHPI
jgi:hypothetical protein